MHRGVDLLSRELLAGKPRYCSSRHHFSRYQWMCCAMFNRLCSSILRISLARSGARASLLHSGLGSCANSSENAKEAGMRDQSAAFDEYFAEHLEILAPLFEAPEHDIGALFELMCCLLHPTGVQGLDENPLLESTALIDDLALFSRQDLPLGDFEKPERTRARLALLSYCHLTEADFFYDLLINLLRVRAGEKWSFAPFADIARVKKTKKPGGEKRIPPSPSAKIRRIEEYATKAGMAEIAGALKQVYLSTVRNAAFHADYTITDTHFHMMRDYYQSPHGYGTQDVPLPELLAIIDRAFAFYLCLA